jgi:coenzyme PQQ precursor peptide PqqA
MTPPAAYLSLIGPGGGDIFRASASRRCCIGGEQSMAWKKPKIVEISLALEINSYACAEIA